MESKGSLESLHRLRQKADSVLSDPHKNTLPSPQALHVSTASLIQHLPHEGLGLQKTTHHLLEDIAPGLNGSSLSPHYYGFVTGGCTPAARIADSLVTLYDQNVSVHLPGQSVATIVEDRALGMLLELLEFDPGEWTGRTFTTGATASNILGLALGREHILLRALKRVNGARDVEESIGEIGILEACRKAGIGQFQLLTTMAHSSLRKAASVVGLGRASVHDVGVEGNPIVFDMEKLEEMLGRAKTASIVVISCGEVNTGRCATHSYDEVLKLRSMCDKHGAWLHVDAAFGIFARALSGPEFKRVRDGARGLELADSITGDAHKLLNVPYDCGFLFCRYPSIAQQVFQNPTAAYLNSGDQGLDNIQSPLNIGIENSRRFRGLPVYTTLAAYGRSGYEDMLSRQVRFARIVAAYIFDHQELELLPENRYLGTDVTSEIFIIVLFKAKDANLNARLVGKLNATCRIYVSGTIWNGEPATRIAISNWQVDVERDFDLVKTTLEGLLHDWKAEGE